MYLPKTVENMVALTFSLDIVYLWELVHVYFLRKCKYMDQWFDRLISVEINHIVT